MINSDQEAFEHAIQAISQVDPEIQPHVFRAIEDGLIALLPGMPPSRQLLRQVLFTGSARLLAGLFEQHGGAPYKAMQADDASRVPLLDLHLNERVDLLRILYQAGISPIDQDSAMRDAILLRPSVEMLDFLLAEAGGADLAFPEYISEAIGALQGDAGAWLGRFMETMTPQLKRACVLEIMNSTATMSSMKALAYILSSGFDLCSLSPLDLRFYPYATQKLLRQTASSHGRLALKAREPDLSAMMARPETGQFFGMTDKDLS